MRIKIILLLLALAMAPLLTGCAAKTSGEKSNAEKTKKATPVSSSAKPRKKKEPVSLSFKGTGKRTVSVSGVTGNCESAEEMAVTLEGNGTVTGNYMWSRAQWEIVTVGDYLQLKCMGKLDKGKQVIGGFHRDGQATITWAAAGEGAGDKLPGTYDDDTLRLSGVAVVEDLWQNKTADDITEISHILQRVK